MKRIISLVLFIALVTIPFSASASIEVSNLSVNKSDLSVTFTSDTDGKIFVYSIYNNDDGTFKSAVSQTFDITVGSDTIVADILPDSDTIYIWDNNMTPLVAPVVPNSAGDGIIHLMGDSIDAAGVENVTVDGTILTIESAGEYTIEGTLSEGQIVVSENIGKKEEVIITLDNVTVTSSASAPFNGANGKITISMSDNSVNTFIYNNTKKYSVYTTTDAPKGAFYSKRDLTIEGAGTLFVTDNYKNALVTGADLEIKKNASLNITAVNNAVKGDNSVEFTKKTGTVTILSTEGDCIKSDAIDSDTGLLEEDKGSVVINGGTFNLTANAGDGIQADSLISISDGNITIVSSGEALKANDFNIPLSKDDVPLTDEYGNPLTTGGKIKISGGNFNLTSNEDAIKAADEISVSGGTFTINSVNDAIQSGESITENSVTTYSAGNIFISNGTFIIETNGGYTTVLSEDADSCKGIKGVTDITISGGSFNINSADDAIHSNYNLTITGGDFILRSSDDGLHADYILTLGAENGSDESHTIDILYSYEGLEGSVINILSGTQYVYSTDDGLNAAGDYSENGVQTTSLFAWGGSWNQGPGGGMSDDSAPYGMAYIKGGKLYIEAYGDGLDSNGSVEMTGGTVIVNGPTSSANGVFDIGDGSGSYFNHIGGTLIGVGTNGMAITINSSQGVAKSSSSSWGGNRPGGGSSSSSGSAGTPVKINTDGGNIVIVPKVNWSYLYASTPDMTKNSSYTYSTQTSYTGGTQILGKTVNNIFYGLIENIN